MQTKRYELHRLTGAVLIDGEGRGYGMESAGVVSRHRTRQAAERAEAAYYRAGLLGGKVEIRDARA